MRTRRVFSKLYLRLCLSLFLSILSLYWPALADDSVSIDPKANLDKSDDASAKEPNLPGDYRPPHQSNLNKSSAPTTMAAAQKANLETRTRYLDAVRAYQQSFTDLEQAVGVPMQ